MFKTSKKKYEHNYKRNNVSKRSGKSDNGESILEIASDAPAPNKGWWASLFGSSDSHGSGSSGSHDSGSSGSSSSCGSSCGGGGD